ncbi:Pimeloyl-ACP methyl ester carboxylesterase OS=Castellaniella defragrans OX=75697 GN=HNR28_000269 PE=4 SV=1 [Castellaniella defragrans]
MPDAVSRRSSTDAAPRLDYVACASPSGVHRMAYWEWGDPDNDRVLLCVHGLTRTGRDFDLLAQALQKDYRVVCPDVVGRGRSDWLLNPAGYVVPQYVVDMVTLAARLDPKRLDWVGTSMGGLIGLALAGALAASPALRPPRGSWGLGERPDIPFTRLVLNDVGPMLNADGLARIALYVGEDKRFASFQQAVDYVHAMSMGFGPHDAAGWEDLTRDVFHEQDGQWIRHYDLRIALPFAEQTPEALEAAEQVLWQAWDHWPGEALVLRGERSDILSADTLREMLARNPRARGEQFPGVGHAPTLRTAEQIDVVRDFLLSA